MTERHSNDVTVKILQSGDQQQLEDFVQPHIESSLFLLSNSRRVGLVDTGKRFEGTYFSAMAGNRIVGVAAHYWLGNVVLQAPEQLPALIDAIQAAGVRPIRGLLGPGAQVTRAKELLAWGAQPLQLDEIEGLYVLPLEDLMVPEVLSSGAVRGRRLAVDDLDLVTIWRRDYHLETLGAEDDPGLLQRCRGEMESSQQRGETWVLEANGELVASTSFNATIDEAVQVGGVWTPLQHRGRGYGTAVVAVSLLDARGQGADRAILFTGDDNLAARRAYAKLGFQRIGDYRIVLRGDGSSPRLENDRKR